MSTTDPPAADIDAPITPAGADAAVFASARFFSAVLMRCGLHLSLLKNIQKKSTQYKENPTPIDRDFLYIE